MESEWNLSDKAVLTLGFNKENSFTFEEKDVREFIKRLKEEICECCKPENIKDEPCENGDCQCEEIEKLAGEKLI